MNDAVRTAIADAALKVARHVHDGGFAGIVVSGASHELSQSLLSLGWNVQYPGEKLPPVSVLPDAVNRMLYKQPEQPSALEPDRETFAWWLHANMPELEACKQEPLLFLDDYSLTGHKAAELPRSLGLQGFTELKVAVFAAPSTMETDRSVFVGTVDNEAVYELQRLSQHIEGKPDNREIMAEVTTEAESLHQQALDELSEISRRMNR